MPPRAAATEPDRALAQRYLQRIAALEAATTCDAIGNCALAAAQAFNALPASVRVRATTASACRKACRVLAAVATAPTVAPGREHDDPAAAVDERVGAYVGMFLLLTAYTHLDPDEAVAAAAAAAAFGTDAVCVALNGAARRLRELLSSRHADVCVYLFAAIGCWLMRKCQGAPLCALVDDVRVLVLGCNTGAFDKRAQLYAHAVNDAIFERDAETRAGVVTPATRDALVTCAQRVTAADTASAVARAFGECTRMSDAEAAVFRTPAVRTALDVLQTKVDGTSVDAIASMHILGARIAVFHPECRADGASIGMHIVVEGSARGVLTLSTRITGVRPDTRATLASEPKRRHVAH